MDSRAALFELLEEGTIPQITPRLERQRLVAKGRWLAEHCLDGGGSACVLGFVEHCLGKSPPQLDVVTDLWQELRRESEGLDSLQEPADGPRRALLCGLLQGVAEQITAMLPRLQDK